MTHSRTYETVHRIAKAIICSVYMLLELVSIETDQPYLGLVLGTSLWFFGVNTTAYAIEALFGHPHHHNWI